MAEERELPPGFELITDGEVIRWRIISTQKIGIHNHLSKEDAIKDAWSFFNFIKEEQHRQWRKL